MNAARKIKHCIFRQSHNSVLPICAAASCPLRAGDTILPPCVYVKVRWIFANMLYAELFILLQV